MANGKKPVLDSKGKPVKNLYQKNGKSSKSPLSNLIRSLNNINGLSVSQGISRTALKSAGNKISNVIPFAGAPGGKKGKD
jgi:hypothetical protein